MKRCVLAAAVAVLVCALPAAAQVSKRNVGFVLDLSLGDGRKPLLTTTGRPQPYSNELVERMNSRLTRIDRSHVFAIAMTGVQCDELRLLNTPASKRVLTTIRAIAKTHQVLKTTYSGAPLASLPSKDDIESEIARGSDAVHRCTGRAETDTFLPPDAALPTTAAAEGAHHAGARLAISRWAVPPTDDRPKILPGITVTCSKSTCSLDERAEATVPVVVADLSTFTEAIASVAANEAFAIVDPTALVEDVIEGVIAPEAPTQSASAIEAASGALHDFRILALEGNRLVTVYTVAVARARCCGMRILGLRKVIDDQFRSIDVSGGGVTFTSKRGSVPITISNNATYPVRVRVEVSSSKLTFPAGSSRTVTISPPGDTTTFEALARSSGTFPLTVRVTNVTGNRTLDVAEFTVRSAAVNLPAVVVTIGALVVFVVWAARRARSRRAKPETP